MRESYIAFQQKLERASGRRLKLRVNDNRSTMLSVRWEPEAVRVSLHKMFLKAPKNVMESLACYLRRDPPVVGPTIRSFIDEGVRQLNYSYRLDSKQLVKKGTVYDLEEIYQTLNKEYFQDSLDLEIGWFGNKRARRGSQVTLGLYCDALKLIKVHRQLDSRAIPPSAIAFIVYHEMVHAVCPPYFEKNGRRRVHSPEFKEHERQFRYYEEVQAWLKQQKRIFFR